MLFDVPSNVRRNTLQCEVMSQALTSPQSYWTCAACSQLNVHPLTMCARCDASMPSTPMPPRSTPSRSGPPLYGVSSPSPGQRNANSPRQDSLIINSPSYNGVMSPSLSDFRRDLANRQQEQQYAAGVYQQRQAQLQSSESSNLQTQLQNAVEAHRLLLIDCHRATAQAAERRTEALLLSSEVASLREKLQLEGRRRQDDFDRHEAELDARQIIIKQLREALAAAKSGFPATTATAGSTTATSGATSVTSVAELQGLKMKLHDVEARHHDALETILKLTQDLDHEKQLNAETKKRASDDLQKVLQGAASSNETSLASLINDMNKNREASDQRHYAEKNLLESSLREAKEQLASAASIFQRERDRSVAETAELQKQIEKLQRAEGTGNTASQQTIQSLQQQLVQQRESQYELQKQNKALLDEVDSLRNTIASGRIPPAPNVRPPAVNTSHNERPRAADVRLRSDVASMERAVGEAVTTPMSGEGDRSTDNHLWKVRIQELELTIAGLQKQVAQVTAERDEIAAALQALKEKTPADAPPAPAAAPAAPPAETAKPQDEEDSSAAELSFQLIEVRKQLNQAREALRHREEDLEMARDQEERSAEMHGRDIKELNEQILKWKGTAETLSKQLQQATASAAAMGEERDIAKSAVQDHEKATADALYALSSAKSGAPKL